MNRYQKWITPKAKKLLKLIDEKNKAQYKLDGTKKPPINIDFRQARKAVEILHHDRTIYIRLEDACIDMIPAMLKLNKNLGGRR